MKKLKHTFSVNNILKDDKLHPLRKFSEYFKESKHTIVPQLTMFSACSNRL